MVGKMNILLGLTGSVATKLAPKIIEALEAVPNCDEVRVVMTEKARMFYDPGMLSRKAGVKVYTEQDEWQWDVAKEGANESYTTSQWSKGLPILHIDLAKWASCFVIAPATANTLTKLSWGICDNLLTCIYAAWDHRRPFIVAGAMNTKMWFSSANQRNLRQLESDGCLFVPPQEKGLACGDVGVGALANADDIARAVMLSATGSK
jgi:phosphopantothenoylcysteine synthetase/decarboxylase